MSPPCLCGATDCPACYPQHFRRDGGRLWYLYPEDEDEADVEAAIEEYAERKYLLAEEE